MERERRLDETQRQLERVEREREALRDQVRREGRELGGVERGGEGGGGK